MRWPSGTGAIELSAGDASLVTYLRSSAKPIQALPVVRARPDLDEEEIALACASHLAAPEQLAVVRRLLSDAPAVEDELECGGAPTPIEHNCSGKHAGFLALCRARDWPTPGYRLLEHPCQQAMLREVAEAAEVEPSSLVGRGGRVRRADLRAAARARRALLREAGLARRRRARRARDACAPGSPARTRRDRRSDDPRPRRMGREGRRRGALLRRSADGLGLALKVRRRRVSRHPARARAHACRARDRPRPAGSGAR